MKYNLTRPNLQMAMSCALLLPCWPMTAAVTRATSPSGEWGELSYTSCNPRALRGLLILTSLRLVHLRTRISNHPTNIPLSLIADRRRCYCRKSQMSETFMSALLQWSQIMASPTSVTYKNQDWLVTSLILTHHFSKILQLFYLV